MTDLVSEEELARARSDPVYRQKLMASSLDRLIEALNRMRRVNNATPELARQIREGVDLAVRLAERLQKLGGNQGPRAA
jgi:hypothetical protein